MAEMSVPEVPQTLEGWYILHDVYSVDWPAWRRRPDGEREQIAAEGAAWLASQAECPEGDSALYSVLTQKGDLMFVHYRKTPAELNRVELSLRQLRLFDVLRPTYSYLSVVEIGLYELTALAYSKLVKSGLKPGMPGFDDAFATEMEGQRTRVKNRLFRDIPEQAYICFYPMNKRRGEKVNWYALTMEERRDMMRGHGRIGHKYHDQVTQIIGGSVGLDDWEWGVSLHADDAVVFKKLVYEMRFDPASALYAEFGPFYIGLRLKPESLPDFLAGKIG